mmetsp:Transcript_26527/g.41042  ORF Transcript_26527/g.41042 Transcript_26527/m.41042 type:complete len:164 (-) Transcript_26527:342-833(-)
MTSINYITLRVSGLGHTLTLEVASCSTVGSLKFQIETSTAIPSVYQCLLARGSKLDVDENTLDGVGLKHRTRIILLHNELYAKEEQGYGELSVLAREIEDLKMMKNSKPPAVISDLVTRICCKLDGVSVNGSKTLRTLRKDLIRKAENIEHSNSPDVEQDTSS